MGLFVVRLRQGVETDAVCACARVYLPFLSADRVYDVSADSHDGWLVLARVVSGGSLFD